VFTTSDDETKALSVDELYDAALPLSLLCEGATWLGSQWAQYEDPLLHAASGYSCGRDTLPLEIAPAGTVWAERVDASDAVRIVTAYLGLPEPFRRRMHLSLTRLGQAKRRWELEDKALDLMIAVEALLANDRDPGEHTFKVALRAGLLTRGDSPERIRARAVFSALYRIRSAVGHAGVAPDTISVPGFGSESSEQVVAEGLRRASVILRDCVLAGSAPDWIRFDLGITDEAEAPGGREQERTADKREHSDDPDPSTLV